MPNWCSNYVTISHEDPAQIAKLIEGAKQEKLFETFIPFPNGEWDYFWAIENWGTKWDISNSDIQEHDPQNVGISFESAWGPPIKFYEKITELGFDVDATYYEEGMQFAGHYTSENGDYSVEYDFNDPEWRDKVEDEDVKDILDGLYESWQEWQEEFEDLEEEDGEDTDEKRD